MQLVHGLHLEKQGYKELGTRENEIEGAAKKGEMTMRFLGALLFGPL